MTWAAQALSCEEEAMRAAPRSAQQAQGAAAQAPKRLAVTRCRPRSS